MPKNNRYKALTSFTLSQTNRLFEQAKPVFSDSYFKLRNARRAQEHAKFLLVIPRAVGTAPERNLIRRRIKHIIYENALFSSAYDWIIIVRPAATNLSFDYIRSFFKKWCTIS